MIKSVSANPKPKQEKPKKWPQRLALVMAVFAFVLFGGGWLLNQKIASEDANGRKSLSPINGQKIWISGQEPFRFEWTGEVDETSSIEVARDHDFRDVVLEEATPKSPFLTDKIPGEGDYYYRLVTRYNGELFELMEPVRFTVVSKAPPQMIYPFGAMTSQEGKAMRFYWQAKHGVTRYRFQLSFDKSFDHLMSDFVVNETQSTPQNLPVGDFYWRVRGEDETNGFTQWAEVRRLTIEKPTGLAKATEVPTQPPPAPPMKVTKSESKKKKIEESRAYASDDAEPIPKLPPAIVKKTVAQKEKPKKEKTKEKAKEKAKAETKTKPPVAVKPAPPPAPAPEVVVVKPPPVPAPRKPASVPKNTLAMPVLKLPPDGVSLVSLNGTQDPILFKWQSVEGAEKYRLEIASDKDFKNFVHSTVSRENQVVVDKLLPKGQIYWRVRAEQGDGKSDWSKIFAIEK